MVDDDPGLIDTLRLVLAAEGHEVVGLADGRAALELLERERVAAVVCDVNMPDIDGFTVCRRLRARGDATPVILLTSRDSDLDEALGLELGADDYLTKPFSTRVLLARIGALVRRASIEAERSLPITAGHLAIDRERLRIEYRGVVIPASVTELRLLAALAERPGRVLARDRLLALAREDDSVVAPRLIDTYVARLRRKLEEIESGAGAQIETVTGAGYRWRT